MSLTYDAPALGNFLTPIKLTQFPRKRFPFRQDLSAIIYEEEYVQRVDYFVPLALSTPHPVHTNAFLVEESDPKLMKSSGLFQWTRSYATLPAERTEFQTTNFTFPSYRTSSSSTTELREAFSETCVAKVVFSYVLTSDPSADLSFLAMFQPKDGESNNVGFVADDTTPTLEAYQALVAEGSFIQSAQTNVSRWMGDIWELRNLKVEAL